MRHAHGTPRAVSRPSFCATAASRQSPANMCMSCEPLKPVLLELLEHSRLYTARLAHVRPGDREVLERLLELDGDSVLRQIGSPVRDLLVTEAHSAFRHGDNRKSLDSRFQSPPFHASRGFRKDLGQNRARERVSPPDLYRSRWGAAPRAIGTLSRGETTLVKKLTLTVTKLPYKSAFYEKGPPLSEHDPEQRFFKSC